MPPQDQLEIITPFGQIWFYNLADFGHSAINIGRHPDNDVIVNGPSVDEHHAVLDLSQHPYRILFLSSAGQTTLRGQDVRVNTPYLLQNLDTIQVDGFQLILLADAIGETPQIGEVYPFPSFTPAPPPIPTVIHSTSSSTIDPDLPDDVDDFITIDLPTYPAGRPEFRINPGGEIRFALRIKNTGERVAEFMVNILGLDSHWVRVFYPGRSPDRVNLLVNEERQVNIVIQPPGVGEEVARAGKYPLSIEVISPTPMYENRVSRLGATLIVNRMPKFTMASSLQPAERTLSWFQRETLAQIVLTNQGNCEAVLRLSGQDDKGNCGLKFWTPGESAPRPSPVELELRHVGEAVEIPLLVEPHSSAIFPWGYRTYYLEVTATLLDSEHRLTASGTLKHKPLLNWFIFALLGFVSLYICMFAYYPRIWSFRFDHLAASDRTTTIQGGTPVSLNWSVWPPFSTVKLQPVVGELPAVKGTATVMPLTKVDYELRVENPLSQLLPVPAILFASNTLQNLTVNVEAREPHILEFRADRDPVNQGESVHLFWQVENSEFVTLTNLTTKSETDVSGQQVFTDVLQNPTTYRLTASNRFFATTAERELPIKVLPPLPVVVAFDVSPAIVNEGDRINIAWQVSGADNVFIDPLGQQASNGQTFEIAMTGIFLREYTLRASKEGREIEPITKRVNVIAATLTPTPTPSPTGTATPTPAATPEIVFFNLSDDKVILGGDDDNNVVASWSVRGDTTNIELVGSAGNFGPIANLNPIGSLPVPVDKPNSFVLTAYNGEKAKNSQTILLAVETATPTPVPPTAPPPPTATPVGSTIVFFRAESGDEPPNPNAVRELGANRYQVVVLNQIGTKVRLSWTVINAKGAKINENTQPLSGDLVVAVNSSKTYLLTTENMDGNTSPAPSAEIKLEVKSNQPPPPYNVSGVEKSDGNVIKWRYSSADESNIIGFRIYRNDNISDPNETFRLLVNEDELTANTRQWTDPDIPTCNYGYYVLAVYYDAEKGINRETSLSSDTSWYSSSCP